MSDYQASSNPRNCFVFHNIAPQSKDVTVNIKRKIFLPDKSELTQTLVRDILMFFSIS